VAAFLFIKIREVTMKTELFVHHTHKQFYLSRLRQSGGKDDRFRALFYVLGIHKHTRNHIDDLFNFKHKCVRPEGLYAPWQTDTTTRLTLFAFNLWSGNSNRTYDHMITPHALFTGNYAPFLVEALRLRFPDYFTGGVTR